MAKNGKKKAKNNHNNKFQRNKTESTKRIQERKSSSSSNDLFSGFGKIDDRSDACHMHIDSKVNEECVKGDDKKNSGTTKPKGLMNLGNTCYANSVLQVLSQTQMLCERLNERLTKRKEWKAVSESHSRRAWKEVLGCNVDDSDRDSQDCDKQSVLDLVLPDANTLSVYVADFLREMNASNQCTVITPSNVINGTGNKYSQFKGRSQQDSHEFLRCILDAIRNDEVRRQRKAILEGLNVEIKKDGNYDDDTKANVKRFGHASNFTLIEEIFGGFLLCSVKCEECESTSQHFEPFFDLSLPVSEEKHKHKVQRKGKEKDEDEVDVSSSVNEEAVNLSVKDRRIRRQQKKAAKREQKLQNKKKNRNNNVQAINGDSENDEEKVVDNNDAVKAGEQVTDGDSDIVDGNLNCKESKETEITECSNGEASTVNVVNDNGCEQNGETESGTIDTLVNGEDDADDEAISDEEKSVNLITSEFESMDLNKGDQLCDVLKPNGVTGKERIRTVSVNVEEKEYREKVKWSLSTITPRTVEPGTTSILSCLASFTSPELLVGANKLICESCGEKFKAKTGIEKKVYSNASKHMTIAFPPPILTLHLKRFEAEGYHTVNLRKITRMVNFPLTFDLSPFVSNIYEPLSRILGKGNHFSRTINYRLYGVVEHSGSLRSGHYTAFVKVRPKNDNLKKFARLVPSSVKVEEILEQLNSTSFSSETKHVIGDEDTDAGRWFYISDTLVSPSSVDRVLHSQAYILFYERIETVNLGPKVLDSENS